MIEGSLWSGCGSEIHVINVETEQLEMKHKIHDSLHISFFVKTGLMIWVAFKESPNLSVFHLQTFKVMQVIIHSYCY